MAQKYISIGTAKKSILFDDSLSATALETDHPCKILSYATEPDHILTKKDGGGLDYTGAVKNEVLKFNGTVAEWVPEGTSFTFSIATFTATGFATGTQLIGSGDVNAIGSITFSATYNNGPATSGHVSKSSWTDLNLTGGGYVGPTVNTEAIPYPTVGTSVTLTLHSGDGTDFSTSTKTATYHNQIRYTATSTASGFAQADYNTATESITTGDNTQTWNPVALTNQYWLFIVPSRLGLPASWYDNSTGLGLDMDIAGAETVSITNSLGFTENHIFVRSTNLLTMTLTARTA